MVIIPSYVLRSNLSGYVQQQDVFIGAVTVREALRFSADLRLPNSTSPLQRATLVDETLRVLQLSHVADSLIGDEEVGVGSRTSCNVSPGLWFTTSQSVAL
jgi:ATP-binding cassette subfamily G (WHITE) protein 2 (SNQ2)